VNRDIEEHLNELKRRHGMYRKNPHRFAWLVSGVALVGLLSGSAAAQTPADHTKVKAQTPADNTKVNTQTPADNTKVNTRDRADNAVTADQQKENPTDRDLAQKIRRSLMNDKALSTYAHNVKIVSQGGQVTLKGPVRSEQEKQSIEAKAVEVAGKGRVVNQMSIAPAK
jgi:hyperosmotically inducible periplasmic protein